MQEKSEQIDPLAEHPIHVFPEITFDEASTMQCYTYEMSRAMCLMAQQPDVSLFNLRIQAMFTLALQLNMYRKNRTIEVLFTDRERNLELLLNQAWQYARQHEVPLEQGITDLCFQAAYQIRTRSPLH